MARECLGGGGNKTLFRTAGRVVDGVRFGPALDEHGEHGEAHVDGAQVAQHEGLEDAVVVRRHVAAHPGGGVREFHQGHVGARNHHHLPHAALVAQQVCHLAKQLHLAPLPSRASERRGGGVSVQRERRQRASDRKVSVRRETR